MTRKLFALCLAVGLVVAAPKAYAYSLQATASLSIGGSNEDAKKCRNAPNQEHTSTENFNKKNLCVTHDACTNLKNIARAALRDQQIGEYRICTKYVSSTDPCKSDCD